MFLKILYNILSNRPRNNINNLLGRWNLKNNQNISSALANLDSCGDRLCGNTETTKQIINKYSNKILYKK